MAGGTWSPTEMPVLPGLYLNFEAAALAAIQAGARGVVIAPVKANWGPVNEFVEITSEASIIDTYTTDETDGATAYTILRFALMGGAKKILAYRLADSSKAPGRVTLVDTTPSTPVDVIELATKYPSDRAFTVTVGANPDSSKKDIKLFEGTTLLKTFTYTITGSTMASVAALINNDPGNKWITATLLVEGNGQLADITTAAPFAGGDPGIASLANSDYTNALSVFETQEFNLLILDGFFGSSENYAALQTSVLSWVSRLRGEGKGIIAVMGSSSADDTNTDAVDIATARSAGFNHEGIVNVGVGVKLDGVNYCSAQVAAYVAGLIAGQKLSEATTYAATPFDDVTRRWTRSEQETAVKNGVFLLVHDGRMVKVLRGMNSLNTLVEGQNNSWKKIRAIRVMDAINADLLRAAEDNYIGKVNNSAEGRLALIGACKQYMVSLAQGGVIEATGWDVYLDPVYYGPNHTKTPASDQVYLNWEARLTDVMELILGTFIVK